MANKKTPAAVSTSRSRFRKSGKSEPAVDPVQLEEQLEESRAQISSLEAELGRLRLLAQGRKIVWRPLITPLIALVLAAIPGILIVRTYWFGDRDLADSLRGSWCSSEFLCRLALPSYFLVVFACLAGLLVLMLIQRRKPEAFRLPAWIAAGRPAPEAPADPFSGRLSRFLIAGALAAAALDALINAWLKRVPDWDLFVILAVFAAGWLIRDAVLQKAFAAVRAEPDFYLAGALGQLALAGLLASVYSAPKFLFSASLFALLAAANLFRFRSRIHPMYWIFSLALAGFSYNLNDWWIATVGDEFVMFDIARALIHQTNVDNIFSYNGAFGKIPLFTSFIQAGFLVLFGEDGFGWKVSNPYLCAFGVVLFYGFLRTFASRRTALIAAALMAASSYVMSFGRIGYSNIQSLFALCLGLAAAAWALRSGRWIAYVATGAAIAFCFYSYPGALYAAPLPLLLLALYEPPFTRQAAQRWGWVILTALLLIFPLFLQPLYWDAKTAGTLFSRPEILGTADAAAFHFESNLLYALSSFLFIPSESHFVAVSYLDPLTGAFFAIGFFLLVSRGGFGRFGAFLLAAYAFLILIVGVTHAEPFPPNTRMYLLVPFYAAMAAYGLAWMADAAAASGWPAGVIAGATTILLAGVFGLNLIQSHPISYQRFGNPPFESNFVRIAADAREFEPEIPKRIVVLVDPTWSIDGLLRFPPIYPLIFSRMQVSEIRLESPALPAGSEAMLSDRDTLILILPWMDAAWQKELRAPLEALGKQLCEYHTPDGVVRLLMYTHPELAHLCR